jgi:ribosome biogenesis ATPase
MVEKTSKKAKIRPREVGGSASKGMPRDKSFSSSATDGFIVSRPTTRYSDFGGIHAILKEVKELIEYPLTHPEVYAHLGVEPPRGILLHGPPGTGKSMLANAIAGESGACFLRVSAPEIVSGMSGESEQKLRELFDEAIANAPSIIFIDEIDAITPKRETSQRGMEKRIVAQLLTSTDSLNLENTGGKPVLIIGATNRPDALDSALRRAGRFDREICVGIPDQQAREHILQVLSKKMKLSGDFNFKAIARKTPGFVGADLVSLTKEAAVIAVNRIFSSILEASDTNGTIQKQETIKEELEDVTMKMKIDDTSDKKQVADEIRSVATFSPQQLEPLSIRMEDFLAAIPKVQPSSKREGFATIPDVTWADIGALVAVREELVLSILHPIQFPERFEALGLKMPAGVLLYGPPGCGKTLLAKAIANESGANFISIKGPELLDKYVGESERAVRQVFQRARASSPCVVFFDELDALCPRRSGGGGSESGNGVSERVVNQLLTEMDGLDARRNVFVIAATNRPDIIDPAMLRPGRLDKLLYVPLPVASDRAQILQTITKNCRLDENVDVVAIANDPRCEGFSGADLSALVREAGVSALREADLSKQTSNFTLKIQSSHFDKAFGTVFPSVSRSDQRIFEKMKKNLRKSRTTLVSSEGSNKNTAKNTGESKPSSNE